MCQALEEHFGGAQTVAERCRMKIRDAVDALSYKSPEYVTSLEKQLGLNPNDIRSFAQRRVPLGGTVVVRLLSLLGVSFLECLDFKSQLTPQKADELCVEARSDRFLSVGGAGQNKNQCETERKMARAKMFLLARALVELRAMTL